VEYDIIFANITAENSSLSLPFPSFAFPFFIPQPTQKVKWFKLLANDYQSQKALKRTHYPFGKLKLVGIIAIPAYKSRDNFLPPPSLSLLGKSLTQAF
jgi:hypothetical protein